MNARAKTLFKTWQRLPELGPKRVADCANGQTERLSQNPRTAACRTVSQNDGARSQILKFIFTTHD